MGPAVWVLLISLAWCSHLKQTNSAPVPANDGDRPAAKKPKFDTSPKCKLAISEVKFGFGDDMDDLLPFIELKLTCLKRRGPIPKNVLSPYKLLILRANPVSLVAVVDFNNFPFDENKKYVVIGSPRVENVDVSMSSPNVESTFSRTDDKFMLPNPGSDDYAIVLIRDDRKSCENLNLFVSPDGVQAPRILTTSQIKSVIPVVVDMMVLRAYDQLTEYQFTYFWRPELTTRGPMFSQKWSTYSSANSQSSWSVCSSNYEGFDSEAFDVTPASPGFPNICVSDAVAEEEAADCNSCDSNFPRFQNNPILHPIKSEYVDAHKRYQFEDKWIDECSRYFPQREKLLETQSIRSWIQFFPQPTSCKFSCFACTKYLELGFRPDVKNKPYIVQSGYFSENIYENNIRVKAHETYPLHEEAMLFHKSIKQSETMSDVEAIINQFEEKEKTRFNATMNVVLFGYAAMKAGVSFHAYESLMDALRITGPNFGWLHHTDDAAQKITKVISRTFHLKLLKQLVIKQMPFSLLVDSSTSLNQPYLAVYFQTLENNVPMTYFYSLVHLAQGEKAKMMAESLKNQLELDSELVPGFSDYFKSKLVAIVSDGASNMVGINESFKVHMSKYVGRDVPNIECLAHKLDNSFKLGVKIDVNDIKDLDTTSSTWKTQLQQLTYFENFEKSINTFYKFYAGRGHKKWIHLLKTAEDMGVVPKRMKYVFPIRWSDSHFKALETIHHNYYALVDDLSQIKLDNDFDAISRSTANVIYDRMTDKTFMIVLHEFLDILSVFKIASKRFQEASAIIIGKVEAVYEVIFSLEQYKTVPGKWLKDFLGSCSCDGKCDGGKCTLNMYDECHEVILNNVLLHNNFDVAIYYSSVRNYLYNNMIASLKKYFKLELLESFELFNPLKIDLNIELDKIPGNPSLDDLYHENAATLIDIDHISATEKVQQICKFYNLPYEQCKQFEMEWTLVVSCIVALDDSRNWDTDPAKFWENGLTACQNAWTPLTREIVGSILVTPFSSSECERGFSLLNNIKTKSRSCLDKDTLDSLIRVKANGPDVAHLNAYEYTIEFLRSYVRVDDTESRNGASVSKMQPTCPSKRSNIFG